MPATPLFFDTPYSRLKQQICELLLRYVKDPNTCQESYLTAILNSLNNMIKASHHEAAAGLMNLHIVVEDKKSHPQKLLDVILHRQETSELLTYMDLVNQLIIGDCRLAYLCKLLKSANEAVPLGKFIAQSDSAELKVQYLRLLDNFLNVKADPLWVYSMLTFDVNAKQEDDWEWMLNYPKTLMWLYTSQGEKSVRIDVEFSKLLRRLYELKVDPKKLFSEIFYHREKSGSFFGPDVYHSKAKVKFDFLIRGLVSDVTKLSDDPIVQKFLKIHLRKEAAKGSSDEDPRLMLDEEKEYSAGTKLKMD